MREIKRDDMGSCHDVSRPREFKLVLCCPYIEIFFMFRKPKRPDGPAIHNPTLHQFNLRHSLYSTLVGVLGEIVEASTPPNLRYFRIRFDDDFFYEDQPLPENIVWKQMFPGREWPALPLEEALPLCQVILSSERSGAQDAETETAFAREHLGCLNSRFPMHNARLANDMGADNVRAPWVEMTILPAVVGLDYWSKIITPFYPRNVFGSPMASKVFWEWRCFSLPEPYQGRHGLWKLFSNRKGSRPENGRDVTIRARVSDLFEFMKRTQMFSQMQRLHFMFRPLEGSSGRPPLKAKTWAGEEDETDMIRRGPKEGDHFLPERPYRPWPEEVVRDFKADGVYWNIRIS